VDEKVVHRLVGWQTLFKILKITVVQVMLLIFLETVVIPFKVFMELKTGTNISIINKINKMGL
jgi:hypothetical protein